MTLRRFALALLATTSLAACSMTPEPISTQEHFQRAHDDYQKIYADYQPLSGPLSMDQAIARALRYNYDQQLAKTEVSLQERQLDLALSQMLPRLAADAGYTWRSNDNASESVSERTRQQSLEYSYSSERNDHTADLQFSWNLLDFGVSYFQAKQQGYRAFVAVERRRKVINNIVKETRAVYWKAATAQRLLPQLDPILADAEKALANSRKAAADNLQPKMQSLEYQQSLLQVVSQLRRIRTDLLQARVQLAALINVPPETELTLAGAQAAAKRPDKLDLNIKTLEELGLALRPELREEAYQEAIDRQSVYKEIIKMMPGVSILASTNYDSNRYLFNNTWNEIGVRATYNIVSLYQGPQGIEAAQAGVEVDKMRRLALSVAVLTQINVGYQQYLRSLESFDTAIDVDDVQKQITQAVRAQNDAAAISDIEKVRRFLNAASAELERDRAYSEVQASVGNLYTSIGLDLLPPSIDTSDMNRLTGQVHEALVDWDAGHLPPVPTLTEVSAAP